MKEIGQEVTAESALQELRKKFSDRHQLIYHILADHELHIRCRMIMAIVEPIYKAYKRDLEMQVNTSGCLEREVEYAQGIFGELQGIVLSWHDKHTLQRLDISFPQASWLRPGRERLRASGGEGENANDNSLTVLLPSPSSPSSSSSSILSIHPSLIVGLEMEDAFVDFWGMALCFVSGAVLLGPSWAIANVTGHLRPCRAALIHTCAPPLPSPHILPLGALIIYIYMYI